jgi:hypothetical protein
MEAININAGKLAKRLAKGGSSSVSLRVTNGVGSLEFHDFGENGEHTWEVWPVTVHSDRDGYFSLNTSMVKDLLQAIPKNGELSFIVHQDFHTSPGLSEACITTDQYRMMASWIPPGRNAKVRFGSYYVGSWVGKADSPSRF